ncbi:MAG: hypothetical protein V1790_17530 [Planctomycetota bacterium]
MSDWFTQNAPSTATPPPPGDWFAENAPAEATAATAPVPAVGPWDRALAHAKETLPKVAGAISRFGAPTAPMPQAKMTVEQGREAMQTPPIKPSLLLPQEKGGIPLEAMRGVVEGIEGLGTAENASLLLGIGGAGAAVKAVPRIGMKAFQVADTALSAYFSGTMGTGAYEAGKDAWGKVKSGDYPGAAHALGLGTVESLFALLAGKHAIGKSRQLLTKQPAVAQPDLSPQAKVPDLSVKIEPGLVEQVGKVAARTQLHGAGEGQEMQVSVREAGQPLSMAQARVRARAGALRGKLAGPVEPEWSDVAPGAQKPPVEAVPPQGAVPSTKDLAELKKQVALVEAAQTAGVSYATGKPLNAITKKAQRQWLNDAKKRAEPKPLPAAEGEKPKTPDQIFSEKRKAAKALAEEAKAQNEAKVAEIAAKIRKMQPVEVEKATAEAIKQLPDDQLLDLAEKSKPPKPVKPGDPEVPLEALDATVAAELARRNAPLAPFRIEQGSYEPVGPEGDNVRFRFTNLKGNVHEDVMPRAKWNDLASKGEPVAPAEPVPPAPAQVPVYKQRSEAQKALEAGRAPVPEGMAESYVTDGGDTLTWNPRIGLYGDGRGGVFSDQQVRAFASSSRGGTRSIAPAPVVRPTPEVARPSEPPPRLPSWVERSKRTNYTNEGPVQIESVESGAKGLRSAVPGAGKILWTHESESGLQPVEIIGKGRGFDQIPGWKFKWLDGPEKGKIEDRYGKDFYEPERAQAEAPTPATVKPSTSAVADYSKDTTPAPPHPAEAAGAKREAAGLVPTGTRLDVELKFPLSPEAEEGLLRASSNPLIEQLAKQAGITKIRVDSPNTFEFSQEGGVTAGGVVRLNPNAADLHGTLLHELGETIWERSSEGQRKVLASIAKRNLQLIAKDSPGYAQMLSEGKPNEAVAQMFSLFDQLPESDRLELAGVSPEVPFAERFDGVSRVPPVDQDLPPRKPITGVRSWEEVAKEGGYLIADDDLSAIVREHGDRQVFIKDVNGGRHAMPASVAARALEDPVILGHVREVVALNKPAGETTLDQYILNYLPNLKRALSRLLPPGAPPPAPPRIAAPAREPPPGPATAAEVAPVNKPAAAPIEVGAAGPAAGMEVSEHAALMKVVKAESELEQVKQSIRSVWTLRPKEAGAENVRLGQRKQELEAVLRDAQNRLKETQAAAAPKAAGSAGPERGADKLRAASEAAKQKTAEVKEKLAPTKPEFVETIPAVNPDVGTGVYTVNRWPDGQYQVKHFSRGLNSTFGSNFPTLEEARNTVAVWNKNHAEYAAYDAKAKAERQAARESTVKPEPVAPSARPAAKPPARSKKLMRADQISDFEVGRDEVVREGDRAFVVDTRGERARTEVQSDVLTPQWHENLAKLTPQQRIKMAEATRQSPYLSKEGKAERLALLEPAPLAAASTRNAKAVAERKGKLTGTAARKAEVARRKEFYKPGNVVEAYGGGLDKVLEYNEKPDGDFRVKVQAVKPDGSIDPNYPTPRTHSTPPEKGRKIISTSRPNEGERGSFSLKPAEKDAILEGAEYSKRPNAARVLLDTIFRSTASRLQREGPEGKELVGKMYHAEDVGATEAGPRIARLMIDGGLHELTPEQRWSGDGSLIDVLRNEAPAASPEIQKTADIFRSIAAETATEAKAAKIMKTRAHIFEPGELPSPEMKLTSQQKISLRLAEDADRRVRLRVKSPFEEWKDYFPQVIPNTDILGKKGPIRRDIAANLQRLGVVENVEEAQAFIDGYRKYVDGGGRVRALEQYLIDSGQVTGKTEAQARANAFKLLKIFRKQHIHRQGSLEYSRDIDLPLWDPDPLRILPVWTHDVSMRLAEVREFGQNNEVINELVRSISQNPNAINVRLNVNKALRIANEPDTGIARASRAIRIVQGFRLGTASIANSVQGTLNPLLVTKRPDIVIRGWARALTPKGRRFGMESGASLEGVINEMVRYAGEDSAALSKFLTATGFTPTERWNRILSANIGRIYADSMLERLKKNPKDAKARFRLEQMGLGPDNLLAVGKVTGQDALIAAKRFSDLTQFRARYLDLPEWASTPMGRVAFQFKNFAFNQFKLVQDELVGELRRGRPGEAFGALLVLGTVFPITGEAILGLRNLISGRKREDEGLERYWNDIASNGALGVASDFMQSMAWGKERMYEWAAGPSGSEAGSAAYNLYSGGRAGIKKGDWQMRSLARQVFGRIPIAGPRIANYVFPAKKPAQHFAPLGKGF